MVPLDIDFAHIALSPNLSGIRMNHSPNMFNQSLMSLGIHLKQSALRQMNKEAFRPRQEPSPLLTRLEHCNNQCKTTTQKELRDDQRIRSISNTQPTKPTQISFHLKLGQGIPNNETNYQKMYVPQKKLKRKIHGLQVFCRDTSLSTALSNQRDRKQHIYSKSIPVRFPQRMKSLSKNDESVEDSSTIKFRQLSSEYVESKKYDFSQKYPEIKQQTLRQEEISQNKLFRINRNQKLALLNDGKDKNLFGTTNCTQIKQKVFQLTDLWDKLNFGRV